MAPVRCDRAAGIEATEAEIAELYLTHKHDTACHILYPTLPGGWYDLVNFIAVEPIVAGRRGLSALPVNTRRE